jgi:hypothetical protein
MALFCPSARRLGRLYREVIERASGRGRRRWLVAPDSSETSTTAWRLAVTRSRPSRLLEGERRLTERELKAAGVTVQPRMLAVDAGYWNQRQMGNVVERGIQVIIPPDSNTPPR